MPDLTTFRLLFTGSRSFDDRAAIWVALDIIAESALASGYERVLLVHGACDKGGDVHADAWYRAMRSEMPLGIERHPANWRKFGSSAGPRRNRHMVSLGADLCLAAIRNNSAGATRCAAWAERAGIHVQPLIYEGLPPAGSPPERAP